jgi:uncharacterized membrane protein YkoI
MLRSKTNLTTMVALITLAGTAAAFAGEIGREAHQQSELNAIANAKTSLSQAIAAAEQETGGKAVDTGLENQDGTLAYEVQIAKGNTVQKVLVDLDSGKVIKVTAADVDQEEDAGRDEAGEHEGDNEHESE